MLDTLDSVPPVLREVYAEPDADPGEALPKDYFRSKSGTITLRVRPVDPIKLQNAATAVKIPKPPTYKTTTITGKVREFVMDEQAANETPGGVELWRKYQEELRNAQGEQFNFLARVTLFYGTEYTPPDDGWEEELAFLGYELPPSAEMRKVLYLMNNLVMEDISNLILKVMQVSTTSEQEISEVTSSFPDTIRQAQGPAGNSHAG